MIISPFIADQAIRAPRKLRRYSAVWLASVPPRATCGTATALSSITAPFATRMLPPAATTLSGSAANTSTIRFSASRSSSVSASTIATSSRWATFKPALTASERPPFSFCTTRRRGSLRLT